MTTPAGWYPAGQPGLERYWDGTQWTEQTRSNVPLAPVPAIPPESAPHKLWSWCRKHPRLASVGGVFLLLVIIGAAASGNDKSTHTASQTTAAASTKAEPTTSPPAAPAPTASVDVDGAKLKDWITQSGHSTNEVQVAVQSVQAGIALLGKSATISDVAAFSGLVQQSKDELDDASLDLYGRTGKPLDDQKSEAAYAASELKDAMGKLRNYLDDQKPSTLSDFHDKFAQGAQDWNEAITALYARAHVKKPPVV